MGIYNNVPMTERITTIIHTVPWDWIERPSLWQLEFSDNMFDKWRNIVLLMVHEISE